MPTADRIKVYAQLLGYHIYCACMVLPHIAHKLSAYEKPRTNSEDAEIRYRLYRPTTKSQKRRKTSVDS